MQLEDRTIKQFKVAKEFSENKRINSIDFSQDGKFMLTSSDDDTIRLYDCEKGSLMRELFSKKYGADLIKHTHAKNTAIHTSTKENDTIRYLSLHDNKYLRYFCGHEKRVMTLCMSPADDTFLSGSLDQTVRIWDLRVEKPTGKLSFPGNNGPIGSFDPEGLIFAVGMDGETLKLFDVRHYDNGPFNTIKYPKKGPPFMTWSALKFSPNGKQMLITTNCEEIFVMDAFSGQQLAKLTIGPAISEPLQHPCEASYSPDSQYILSGSEDGCVHVWSANEFNKLHVMRPPNSAYAESVQCVKFNPRYMMIGSASNKMSLWVPSEGPPEY